MLGTGALIGYAVGTVQVLFVDWWRRLATHRRQLRLLRAELRRMRTFSSKFGWESGLPPEDEHMAIPPRPSELFMKAVGEVEWTLTDENTDDNSQQSLLHIVDGTTVLKHYADKVHDISEKAPQTSADEKEQLRERGAAYANAYDARVDEVLFLIDDALSDLDRRLQLASTTLQLKRLWRGIPRGENPAPLGSNDARLVEWKRKQIPPTS